MPARCAFTVVTPLPAGIPRHAAVAALHDHAGLIGLSPLVVQQQRVAAPAHSAPDERGDAWFRFTEAVPLLPRPLPRCTVRVDALCSFADLSDGVRSHTLPPLGLDLRVRWQVADGEPAGALCLREEVELRCNALLMAFVRGTIEKSHAALTARLVEDIVARAEAGGA